MQVVLGGTVYTEFIFHNMSDVDVKCLLYSNIEKP